MNDMGDPNTGFGYFLIFFVILPFWLIYFIAAFFTKGRARSLIGMFGLTLLSTCVTGVGSGFYSVEETPGRVFIRNWNHRPHLWLTVLLSMLLFLAVAAPLLKWAQHNQAGAFKGLFIALPAIGAYLAYVWTIVGEYGIVELFRP